MLQIAVSAVLIAGAVVGGGVAAESRGSAVFAAKRNAVEIAAETAVSETVERSAQVLGATAASEKAEPSAAVSKPEAKPAAKSTAKPAAKTAAKPAAKTAAKPAAKPETKPEAKPEAKPAAKETAEKADAKKDAYKAAAQPLTAAKKDFEALAALVAAGVFPEGNYPAAAPGSAAKPVVNYDLVEYVSDQYGFPEPEFFHEGNEGFATPDPLNKMTGSCCYARYDGETVDWILKNILNVEPDHSYNEDKGDDISYWYYYDGFYYEMCSCGWDSYEGEFVSESRNSDGSYTVAINSLAYGETKNSEHTVTAKLLEVDGRRVWNLVSVSTTYVNND